MNSKPIVVNIAEYEWETQDDYPMTPHGVVRWKTLLGGERTASHSLTLGFAELSPGEKLVRHRHLQVETYYILEGSGQVEIEGAVYPLEAGAAVFIPGNAWHQLSNTGPDFLRLIYTFPVDKFSEVEYVY